MLGDRRVRVARMPAGRAAWSKDPAGNLPGLIEFAEA